MCQLLRLLERDCRAVRVRLVARSGTLTIASPIDTSSVGGRRDFCQVRWNV